MLIKRWWTKKVLSDKTKTKKNIILYKIKPNLIFMKMNEFKGINHGMLNC